MIKYIFLIFIICLLNINAENGFCKDEANKFNALGFPNSNTFDIFNVKKSSLNLASAGMRRKNLFVVEVDVYKVGLYLSEQKEKDLAAVISKGININSLHKEDSINIGISLIFVRSVGSNKVIDAIIEALPGKGESFLKSIQDFKKMLVDGIGPNGVKENDEIQFVFKGKAGVDLGVGVKGKFMGWINNKDLREKLIDVYVGQKPVAPEVTSILKSRYTNC